MRPVSMSISNGRSTVAVSKGTNPMIVRSGSSGAAISGTSICWGSPPSRSISSVTTSPGWLSASSPTRSSTVDSGTPSMLMMRSPGSSDSSAGAYVVHSVVAGFQADEVGDDDVTRHDLRLVEAELAAGRRTGRPVTAVRIICSESWRCWVGVTRPNRSSSVSPTISGSSAPIHEDRTHWAGSRIVTK